MKDPSRRTTLDEDTLVLGAQFNDVFALNGLAFPLHEVVGRDERPQISDRHPPPMRHLGKLLDRGGRDLAKLLDDLCEAWMVADEIEMGCVMRIRRGRLGGVAVRVLVVYPPDVGTDFEIGVPGRD